MPRAAPQSTTSMAIDLRPPQLLWRVELWGSRSAIVEAATPGDAIKAFLDHMGVTATENRPRAYQIARDDDVEPLPRGPAAVIEICEPVAGRPPLRRPDYPMAPYR